MIHDVSCLRFFVPNLWVIAIRTVVLPRFPRRGSHHRGEVYRLQAPHDVGHGCGLVAPETLHRFLGLQCGHVGSADRLGPKSGGEKIGEMSELPGDRIWTYQLMKLAWRARGNLRKMRHWKLVDNGFTIEWDNMQRSSLKSQNHPPELLEISTAEGDHLHHFFKPRRCMTQVRLKILAAGGVGFGMSIWSAKMSRKIMNQQVEHIFFAPRSSLWAFLGWRFFFFSKESVRWAMNRSSALRGAVRLADVAKGCYAKRKTVRHRFFLNVFLPSSSEMLPCTKCPKVHQRSWTVWMF